MANYWLHRISHEWDVSKVIFDKGYLTIGWSDLVESKVLEVAKNKDETEFDRLMKESDIAYRSRGSLYRFFQMRPGDVVVVPLYEGTFAIADVVESAKPITDVHLENFSSLSGLPICINKGYLRINNSEGPIMDLGFFVKIKNAKVVRRSFANPELQSRMKVRQTNVSINDLNESVNNARMAEAPVNLHDVIMESIAKVVLSAIDKHVSPDKFEKLVKWYIDRIGATKTYIPSKNESGKYDGADADIIAEFDPMGIVIYIQVKKHKNQTETSDWAVEQISKYKKQKEIDNDLTYISWAITTAAFSEKAKALAKINNVRLIDGEMFSKMLVDAGVSDINEVL